MKQCLFSPRAGGFRTLAKTGSCVLALVHVLGWLAMPACGATRTWNGQDGSLWSDPDNWSPSGAPQNGDLLTFPDVGLADRSMFNDLPNPTLNTILFTAGGYSLTGNALTLNQGITDNHVGDLNRVRCDIQFISGGGRFTSLNDGQLEITGITTLANNQDLIITASLTNIIVSGAIGGGGGLIKRGEGALFLRGSAANTYTGPTRLEAGATHLAKTSAARAISANVILDGTIGFPSLSDHLPGQYPPALSMLITNGGVWGITNGATVTNLVLAESGRIEGTGLLNLQCDVTVSRRNIPLAVFVIECALFLGSETRTFLVSGPAELRVRGQIIGPGPGANSAGLVKTGLGQLVLDAANLYFGPTVVEGGELVILDGGALGGAGPGAETRVEFGTLVLAGNLSVPEPLLMNGGDVRFSGTPALTGPIALNQSCFFQGGSGSRLEITGVVSGPATFEVIGGTVRLSGAEPNTFGVGLPVLVQPRVFLGFISSAALELAKPNNIIALPSGVSLRGSGTNAAVLRNFQDGGVSEVSLDDGASWLFNGHSVAPTALTFLGPGLVDTQGGQLHLTNPGLNQLQAFRDNLNPFDTYTAQILGIVACLAPTNRISTHGAGVTLNIPAQVTGPGAIRKQGAGTLVLGGNNNFTGPLTVVDGLLAAASNAALGATGAGTTVLDGATLQIETNPALAEPLNLRGAGRGGTDGALNLFPATGVGANIVLAAGATVRVDSSFAILAGVISGPGSLTKTGGGALLLGSGAGGANTYLGDTTVDAGELVLGKPVAVAAVPGHLVIGSGRSGTVPSASVRHVASFAIIGSVTVNRAGLWNLDGFSEGFGIADLQGRPPLTLNEGGDVQTGAGALFLPVGGDIAVDPGNVGGSFIAGRLGLDPGPHRFNVADSISFLADLELDVPAAISQTSTAAELVKEGFGRLRLGGSNSFGGAVRVNAGTLIVSNDFALGGNLAGTSVSNNAALVLEGGRFINNEVLTLNSSNTAAFRTTSGSNTWTGPIVLARDTTVSVSPANGFLQALNNTISGAGGLTKSGPGTLQFRGSVANTYGGLTTVAVGLLEAGRANVTSIPGDAVIGDDSTSTTTATLRCLRDQQFSPAANVTVNRSGHLHLFPLAAAPPPQPTLNTVRGQGNITIPFTTSLTLSNDVSFELAATVTGTGALNKRRALTTVQVTSESFFGGPTTVHEGFWRMDGNWPASPLAVKGDGELRGDGVLGNLTVETNGIVRPNSNVPGRLGADLEMSSANFLAGGRLGLALYGPHPTGGNDSLVANGPVTLNNTRLSAGFQYPAREGDVAVLLRKNSAGPINGVFSGFPEGVTRQLGDVTVRATYLGGDGNDFTLTVTNLPLAFLSYGLAEGNGNQTAEPDECNLLFIALTNRRPASLTITSAVVRAVTPSAVVTIASARFPVIPAGAARNNSTPFQFRTEPAFPCGTAAQFELVLGVLNEGEFAVAFTVPGGNDCAHPTGGCESCVVVSGRFTPATATLPRPHIFAGAPSICLPAKPCPEGDNFPEGLAVPLIAHSFTNITTNELCVTAQLRFGCPGAPTNALGAVAYLHTNAVQSACVNYLGDTGADGTQPFSFRVPPNTNFVILISARATNIVCPNYSLELFGLPCPPPTLHIAKDTAPDRVLLQWSTAYPGYRLQSVNSLDGPGPHPFNNVASPPVLVGGKFAVSNAVTAPRQFFRLTK